MTELLVGLAIAVVLGVVWEWAKRRGRGVRRARARDQIRMASRERGDKT